ncbi:hypothetical protein CEXT_255161 [Caerostris extrusa]|uniref:Uncharacterized protein n=1 Tax=Caerostris extrusa TaxID=172846 RepID=A0AAV4Y5N1_CAEEX|nr:hypothetical protein CEXT_255161 [Caerostris extrusa]
MPRTLEGLRCHRSRACFHGEAAKVALLIVSITPRINTPRGLNFLPSIRGAQGLRLPSRQIYRTYSSKDAKEY